MKISAEEPGTSQESSTISPLTFRMQTKGVSVQSLEGESIRWESEANSQVVGDVTHSTYLSRNIQRSRAGPPSTQKRESRRRKKGGASAGVNGIPWRLAPAASKRRRRTGRESLMTTATLSDGVNADGAIYSRRASYFVQR